MNQLLSYLLSILLLISNLTIKGSIVITAKTINTIEYNTVESYKITYKQFEEHGGNIVTNYINPDVNIISIDSIYSTIDNTVITYTDAELTSVAGYIVKDGWMWNIEKVTTVITTNKEATETCTANNINISTNNIKAIINNSIIINNYNSIIYTLKAINNISSYKADLTSVTLNRNREYKTKAAEDG
ncbi:MAG: hypothetical protein J6D47_15905 [Peptostreptococcaceae bacterium]|nr:hypothetical protein [Peptostreptococcaceae bacterium]